MITVVVVVHILIAVGLISLILLQKTEGNSAGGGFSVSSVSAMMQPRARPNPLSRATTILGISFFVTSIGLALLARQTGPAPSILDAPGSTASAPKVDEIRVPSSEPAAPAAPAGASPAATPQPAAPPAAPKH
jgi:preprotein translocase subunit SecG